MCLRFSHARSDDLLIRLADYRLLLPSVLLLLIFMFLLFLFCSSIQLSYRTNWCLEVLNHGNKNPSYTSSFSEITKTNVTTKRQHPNKQNQKLRKKEKREKPESFFCGNTLRPVVHWKKVTWDYKLSEVNKELAFLRRLSWLGN